MKRIFLALSLLLLALVDRGTKLAVLRGWSFNLGLLRLERFDNHGLVFSIPSSPIVAIVSMSVVIIFLLSFVYQRRKTLNQKVLLAVSCILLGAMSNLTDRILYSVVIDWISFGRWFPIFNFADVMIGLGVALWIFDLTSSQKAE